MPSGVFSFANKFITINFCLGGVSAILPDGWQNLRMTVPKVFINRTVSVKNDAEELHPIIGIHSYLLVGTYIFTPRRRDQKEKEYWRNLRGYGGRCCRATLWENMAATQIWIWTPRETGKTFGTA